MNYMLDSLIFEVTRKCNLRCGHCMRGLAQNIDMNYKVVETFFTKNNIKFIGNLSFSGGEPTLNSDLIEKIIDLIIEKQIVVGYVSIVTNGQVFSEKIIDTFKRFNDYCNQKKIKNKNYNDYFFSGKKNVVISFSVDQYHSKINTNIRNLYYRCNTLFYVQDQKLSNSDLIQTGLSKIGKPFQYKLKDFRYKQVDSDCYSIIDPLYINAKGYATSEGMGQYKDMDYINMGNVLDISLTAMLANFGMPTYNTNPITINSPKIKERKGKMFN